MQSLPIGKLRAETLQAIFDKHHTKDPRVVVGPRVGEDAAVIDMGDRYLIATSDPITFATAEIGWYALHVNANDIAVRGARPRWFLATLLLPAGATSQASVEALFADLHAACEELEVVLVGGHTEVTHGLDRPIVAGTMLGEVDKDKLVTTAGARVGDAVVMTKGVPLEGAAILAREKESGAAGARRVPGGDSPGEGVPQDARAQRAPRGRDRLRAGHGARDARSDRGRDRHRAASSWPTPPGSGFASIAIASWSCRRGGRFATRFGLDPLGTIASGALLMTLAPADAGIVIHALARESIDCHFIGQVVPREQGVTLMSGSRQEPMPVFAQDEITRLFQGG